MRFLVLQDEHPLILTFMFGSISKVIVCSWIEPLEHRPAPEVDHRPELPFRDQS
jgi:hypothetical protein